MSISKLTKAERAQLKSISGAGDGKFSDYDGDGYPDQFDCDPLDPNKDGILGDTWARISGASSRAQAAARRIYRPAAVSGREAVSTVYRRAYGAGAAARSAASTRISRAREFVRAPARVREERIERGKKAFVKKHTPSGTISPISKRIHEESARVAWVARGFEGMVDPKVRDVERALGFHSEAIPKPVRWTGGQVKKLGYGGAFSGPAAAVEMVGMVPGGLETIARTPRIFPAAATLGLFEMGRTMWHGATTDPGRTTGELISMGAIAKGMGEVPKVSPYYRGRAAGVKVFAGEPSWIGRLRGKKPHPTPEAKMGEMLDPAIYETPQKFYHGTSMEFVGRITKAERLAVHPEASALRGAPGIEPSLFLSKPGTPYARFATPQRIAKIGSGTTAQDVPVFQLEQMMRGRIPSAEGIKSVKPSKGLSELIAKRETLSRELAGMEMSKLAPISPKRMAMEAKLYDVMHAVEKRVIKDYKAATGEKVSVRDRPGAFLEIEQKPFRPSEKLIAKAKTRESLRAKEKDGTISSSDRAKLRKLEKELKKEATSEYFDAPVGEVFPSPKPMYGYEWKGIPEAEFVMRAGTELYPTTTGRSRAYALLGIKKGTHFAQDPSTGRWIEILRVTTDPVIKSPPKHLIDIPKMLDPFRPTFPKVRKLSTKQKSEVVRLKKQIADAQKVGDAENVMRLSERVRTIEVGRPTPRIAAPIRRVSRTDLPRMTERDMPRMTERPVSRPSDRDAMREHGRDITREVSRDVAREPGRDITREVSRDVAREHGRDITREVSRDVAREHGRDITRDIGREVTLRPPPTVYVPPPPPTPPPTTIRKKKDKKKVKPPKAKPEMAVGWKQRHRLITLESLLGYKI